MELVGNSSSHLGEGPFWDSVSKRLLWVDILGKKILEHDFENDVTIGKVKKYAARQAPRSYGILLDCCSMFSPVAMRRPYEI